MVDIFHRQPEETSQIDIVEVSVESFVVHLKIENLTKVVAIF